jgi:DNA-binding NarL/FixJ family response regulator
MTAIRVLVADDHPMFRNGIVNSLAELVDVELVGEAADGDLAVALTVELLPDVVLMDLQMPGRSGIEATREISRLAPDVKVLVLTMFEDDDSVFAAMRAGARGYLLKGANQDDVERAIRTVAAGEAVFGAAVASRLLGYFAAPPSTTFPELTEREREVLDLLASGRNNQAIAGELVLSLKTVRNHVSNIFAKLRVADRSEAIVKARDGGLGRAKP